MKKNGREVAAKPRARRTPPRGEAGAVAPFPIVGIGASAGGLEAFRRLLSALPADTGMAYVLVQHLDPSHESILAELLSEATSMEVAEVRGDMRVEPNRVYVIPPANALVLEEGTLKLIPRSPAGTASMPIDSFLGTLALARGSQAIGVVLSGMGSDGTLGLQAIEAEGGIAFAQEPSSARNTDMPRSAIAAGGVDFVLTPEAIASELSRLGRHPYLSLDGGSRIAADALVHARPDGSIDHADLTRVLDLLRQSSGTDFGAYKKTTLGRRIARRMAVSHIETLAEYARRLEGDAAEVAALYEDCLISVTSFFRDADVFRSLSERVLPRLLEDRPPDAPVRVWVPGCATGEEAYSIAMCLLEHTAEQSHALPLQIFATDLSDRALAKARDGAYLVNIARDVSPERLRRFFVKVGDHYQISKAIREMCVFARHDLTRDPPYSRIDLISCRNLLIYLEPRLQEIVFATFHYALRPEGFLMLGAAETVGSSSTLFAAIDEPHRIYSRKATSGPPRLLSVVRRASPALVGVEQSTRRVPAVSEVSREADRMLLARFGAAGVVVDEGLRVTEFRGDTGPFLDHGQGKASLNLEPLLRKGLLVELRRGIEEVRSTDLPVRKEGLQVRYQDQLRNVTFEVVPIKGRAAGERCLLILFEMQGPPTKVERRAAHLPPADGADAKDREIVRLGQGLAQTTEYMHTLVHEHEAALEELQSTNEETLSGNEELRSLNEELQTAKEEIQSANEELSTLNQELQDRNVQLARSNADIQRGLDDANALVDTVPQPLVILDGDLRIENANVAFYETFQVTAEQTLGRLLSELANQKWDRPELLTKLSEVLVTGASLKDLEIETDFPRIGSRTMSLNARRLHGGTGVERRVLLAMEDRTEIKRAERGRDALFALERHARKQAEGADHLKDQFVATVSHELRGPLTVISGWMNILQVAGENPDAATLARALAAIGRGVTAQNRLISDLLDHSRIMTGKVDLERVPIDLLAVAEAALVGVRAAAEAKDIDIQLSGERNTSIVLGDSDRMQQVLWNLLLNAVKFTPQGGRVQMSVARVDDRVRLTVSDTGCGISREFLPHVFDRFRQAEDSSNRSHQGLGLGLALVRELVALHGGTVYGESPGKDQGATFTIVLPIPAVLIAPNADGLPSPPASPPHGSSLPYVSPTPYASSPSTIPPPAALLTPRGDVLEGTKVLVVDDDADARDALARLLERYGAGVRSAASVAEAMRLLAQELPDVLVSDLGMPIEDGYELLRRVRLLPPEAGGRIPSLAVSAYATKEHREKVTKSGFQKHLEKPVAPGELVTAVARLAGRLD